MVKYPAIDPDFYEWGVKTGMTDEQIADDWKAYCEGLEEFFEETSTVMGEPVQSMPMQVLGGSE